MNFLKIFIFLTFIASYYVFANNSNPDSQKRGQGHGHQFANTFFDLSYSLSNDTIVFPGLKQFQLFKDNFGRIKPPGAQNEFWYSSFSFCTGEHIATHLDAPLHFFETGKSVTEIPVENLINVEGSVIDISHKIFNPSGELKEGKENYALEVEDLLESERRGRYKIKGVLFVHTSWGKYWMNKNKYFGIKKNTEGNETVNFPGVSLEAAKWLFTERGIVGLGIDTASTDPGFSKEYVVHIYFSEKNIYAIENVANLHLLLAFQQNCCQWMFHVMPLKIIDGSGAPTRILAFCKY